jgi:polar amino acid transport system substrate-binding protein
MSEASSTTAKGCILVVFLGGAVSVVALAALWMLAESDPVEKSAKRVDPASQSAPQPAPSTPDAAPAPAPTGAAVERIRARGKLIVAMDTGEPELSGTPPMFFVDAQGGRDGLDYALARTIADTLGARDVELVHGKYSALEDVLLAPDRVDVLISGYSPTETPGVAWSDPYLEYGLCLVVPSGSPVKTTLDLFGKKVGIFDDDAAAADVTRLVKGYTELVRMEDGYWDALVAGRFDGFLYDYPYAVAELQKFHAEHPDKKSALRIVQYNLTDSTYAVGVRSADADLLAAVNTSIAAWRGSDAYGTAIKRYLKGGEVTAVVDVQARRVVVKKGDTLSGIALRELGSTDRWKDVWDKNRSRFPNPHLIEVGDEVLLP